jgi:hypothetical protein
VQDGTGLIQKLSATVSRLDTNEFLPWLRRMTEKPVNDNTTNNNNVSDAGGTELNNSSSMSAKHPGKQAGDCVASISKTPPNKSGKLPPIIGTQEHDDAPGAGSAGPAVHASLIT